ncbi:MAG: class I SAM-dependent methyltransferase, partial [Caulobacterales bacterium]|nr:class I SAM-dependent methyltransferase [Caulobacterales bacterium]
RCRACGSLNAVEPVDLAAVYERYPLHEPAAGWAAFGFERAFAARAARLPRCGVAPGARVLDYGGGHGGFVRRLRRQGYEAHAYDPAFDAAAPTGLFDAVTCQDVIEHVEDPPALMRALCGHLAPGGALLLGAPLADGVDLAAPERWVMHLHQPYHRCIPSERALRAMAAAAGLRVERLERRFAGQSAWPGVNARFVEAYGQACGGLIEATLEPPRLSVLARRPALIAAALFGAWDRTPSNVAAVLRRA